MSAAQSRSMLESKIEALQSHFTWDLDASRSELLCLRDNLEDIGSEEGYSWLGHIYNLLGFIHYQLGSVEDARRLLSMATEAFRQIRNTVSDEGPWLVVNYGNLAWLHHHQGERAESERYLSKVDARMREHPSPSQDELHPEIYAEKAWTLMKFSKDKKLLAVDYFERAMRMQPDRVEWRTSHALALVKAFKRRNENLGTDILEKMRIAKEHDPDNLYLAALYFEERNQEQKNIQCEVRELARRVLRKPVSSYSGLTPLLRLYKTYISNDEAIDLAEEALERHPDERYLKRCAVICYKTRILSDEDNPLEHSMINRAISLCEDVISHYPDSSLKMQIYRANIYAKSHNQVKGDQIFEELLQSDLDPKGKQMLYNYYAKHLHYSQKIHESIKYHMEAAAIPQQSFFRDESVRILQRIRGRNKNRMCGEIGDFLINLQH